MATHSLPEELVDKALRVGLEFGVVLGMDWPDVVCMLLLALDQQRQQIEHLREQLNGLEGEP